MKTITIRRFIAAFLVIFTLGILAVHVAEAQRRGSFGGSRSFGGSSRSFGGSSRSFGGSSSRSFSGSSGGYSSPSTSSRSGSSFSGSSMTRRPSFSGTSMSSSQEQRYRSSYGVPRKSEVVRQPDASGNFTNYTVHSYGGYSDGLMTGYVMGRTSMWWSTPFHPAFYYSRPSYVLQPDGTYAVYPPTFSFFSLIIALVIFVVIGYIIYKIVRFVMGGGKKATSYGGSGGSFS